MDIGQFKTLLFDRAREAGFSDCEIYYAKGLQFYADIFEGAVREYKNSHSAGLSFRGNYGDKTGYAYTETITPDIIDFLLENAKQNAEITDEEKEHIFPGSESYIKIEDITANDMPPNNKIDLARAAEKAAYDADARVKQVLHSCVTNGCGEVIISNTAGLDLRRKTDYAAAYVYVKAQEGDCVKTGMEVYIGYDLSRLDPAELAEKAVKKAVGLLGARDVTTGKYPVMFNNMCAAELLSCFTGVFYADNVQKGFSLLGGKIGEQIAAGCLTLNDYATHKDSVINLAFDDEGVAAYNKAVIKNGMLKTYLHNQKSAARDNTASTGNGFKMSFKSTVTTAPVNFFIAPSDVTEDKLIAQMGNGIYITSVMGLHAGANAVSGDFSLKADGFLVEGGKIAAPVEQFTVGGNFYTLLETVEGVADNLFFNMPATTGVIGAPSVLVRELTVSGGREE